MGKLKMEKISTKFPKQTHNFYGIGRIFRNVHDKMFRETLICISNELLKYIRKLLDSIFKALMRNQIIIIV